MEPLTPISPAEFRSRTEYLGLNAQDLAELLDVQDRTVRRWFAGMSPIPAWLIDNLAGWEEVTRDTVESLCQAVQEDPDKILPATIPQEERPGMPERWWRHVLARVLERHPEASIS